MTNHPDEPPRRSAQNFKIGRLEILCLVNEHLNGSFVCLLGRGQGGEPFRKLITIGRVEGHQGVEFSASGRLISETKQAPDEQLSDLEFGGVQTKCVSAGRCGRLPIAWPEKIGGRYRLRVPSTGSAPFEWHNRQAEVIGRSK